MDIYKKFAAAWERVENPPLDSVNPHFKSKFASLGAVYKAIRKACEGIAYMQAFGTEDSGGDTILTINSWLQDAEGGRIDLSSMRMPVTDNPQQQGSIITYYRRYVAVTDWGIVGEEDDDAESAMPKPKPQAKPKKDELADLWQQCIDLGVKPDGLKSWYEANGFKGKKLTQLNNAERMKVKAYLTDMRESIQVVSK